MVKLTSLTVRSLNRRTRVRLFAYLHRLPRFFHHLDSPLFAIFIRKDLGLYVCTQ